MSFLGLFTPNVAKLDADGNLKGLLRALRYKDPSIRRDAAIALLSHEDKNHFHVDTIDTLVRLGDQSAVEALLIALKQRDPSVREHAARALGEIGDAKAIRALLVARDDKYESGYFGRTVSAAADRALKSIVQHNVTSSTDQLVIALHDQTTAKWAGHYLAWEVGVSAIEPLITIMADGTKDVRVRKRAANILQELSSRRDLLDQDVKQRIITLYGVSRTAMDRHADRIDRLHSDESIEEGWYGDAYHHVDSTGESHTDVLADIN